MNPHTGSTPADRYCSLLSFRYSMPYPNREIRYGQPPLGYKRGYPGGGGGEQRRLLAPQGMPVA